MKRIFFVSLVFCALVTLLPAQTHIISYDFETGKINNLKPVKTGEFVIIQINNINTFRYGVTIEGKNIDYSTPIPTELQTLFRITQQYGDQGDPNEALGETGAASEDMSELAASNIDPELKETVEDLSKACKELTALTARVAEVKFNRMELIGVSKLSWADLSTALAPIDVVPRQQMKQDYQNYLKKYYEAAVLYNKAQKEANNLGDSDSEERIKTAKKQIKEAYDILESDNYLKLIDDVITLNTALRNQANFKVVSAPVQIDADYVSFLVKATPSQVNALLPIAETKTSTFEVPAQKGWKADFSVGPVLSFGDESRDDNYFFEPDPNDDTMVILREGMNQNAVRPGIAAMMHAYSRTGKFANYGIMMGVGAGFKSIDDTDLSFYLGGSAVLGKKQKIILSVGVGYNKVDRLKSGFTVDNPYSVSTDIIDVTESVFRPAPFFSISYSLSERVEVK